jgi:hypothetical protein
MKLKKMKIDDLDKKPEPQIESLGIFKLKDRQGRNAVQIEFGKSTRPLTEAEYLFITKVPGQNNKIDIKIQWKPKLEKIKPVKPSKKVGNKI